MAKEKGDSLKIHLFIFLKVLTIEKQKFNKFIENKGHKELKYNIEEVDPLEKSKLD